MQQTLQPALASRYDDRILQTFALFVPLPAASA